MKPDESEESGETIYEIFLPSPATSCPPQPQPNPGLHTVVCAFTEVPGQRPRATQHREEGQGKHENKKAFVGKGREQFLHPAFEPRSTGYQTCSLTTTPKSQAHW